MSRAAVRRTRVAELSRQKAETALAITCPACGAEPGVWCFWRRLLGPDMHERRWSAATPKES